MPQKADFELADLPSPVAGEPTATAAPHPVTFLARMAAGFRPPDLPPTSRVAFRFHMAFALLEALALGILYNVPLMAVKAMGATDRQLQLPIIMTSLGLFSSVFTGIAMSTRRKKPFVLVPGIASAVAALSMAWTSSALWFLFCAGLFSIFDFAMRPAMPSILRTIYPAHCRSHVAGTLRQYASAAVLGSSLFFAWLLAASTAHVGPMIQLQVTIAGLAGLAAFACFQQLPNRGDGCVEEALLDSPAKGPLFDWRQVAASLAPLQDRRFRRYLTIFFLYTCGNLFYMGIVPAFIARDLGYGYVQATLLLQIVPAVTGFLAGGRLTAWFDRTSIWRSFGVVAFLWSLDPLLLAIAPYWPVIAVARIVHGPAMVGSLVLAIDTGVHSFSRPGPETSRYMALVFLVNGLSRFLAPSAAALLASHLSHRWILFCGGSAILAASGLFFYTDRTDRPTRA
jgi:MFS family permease